MGVLSSANKIEDLICESLVIIEQIEQGEVGIYGAVDDLKDNLEKMRRLI